MEKIILIIDDEGIITKTVGNLLSREGYKTQVANSGEEAIKKVKQNNFDLIVTDIRMPHMDGLETVINIKEYLKGKKIADIPIIFITGYADSNVHLNAQKLGRVIYKPFDIKEFISTVTDVLRN